jgi:pyridoxamine 5'-phosphate oxidase family protein
VSRFSEQELAHLATGRLGRLATIDAEGPPHVVALGWNYRRRAGHNRHRRTDLARTRRFRNVPHNPNVALVIDDEA